jgi:vancomycin resistance protein YoaR
VPRPRLGNIAVPKRLGVAGFVIAGMVLVVVLGALVERIVYRGRILPGVAAARVHVAGDDERAALRAIEPEARAANTRTVRVRANGKQFTLDPRAIGYRADAGQTVRDAREAGRSRNPLAQIEGVVLRRVRADHVDLSASWNPARLDGVLDDWDRRVGHGLVDGGLKLDGARVTVIEPNAGVGIIRSDARRRLGAALRGDARGVVTLPVGRTSPSVGRDAVGRAAVKARRALAITHVLRVRGTSITITPEQLAAAMTTTRRSSDVVLGIEPARLRFVLGAALGRLERPAVDAGFAVDGPKVAVVPSVTGRQVDLERVAASIFAGRRSVVGRLVTTRPAHDTAWVQRLHITGLVSTFTTYHPAGQARVKNIHHAADVVNNTIVEPGHTFSLNAKLGQRSARSGYVRAPVFAADEGFFEDFGGGVSQFSTTLFNATFFGGYKDVTHTPHSIYISRYPMGREATLNYGSIDNEFKNDTKSGVLIRTSYTAASITVSYYGDTDGRRVKAEGPHIIERTPATMECLNTGFLMPGATKPVPEEPGYDGIKVENFRIISKPGQPDARERFWWTYQMRPKKVFCGVAAPTPPATPPAPTPPAPGTPPAAPTTSSSTP